MSACFAKTTGAIILCSALFEVPGLFAAAANEFASFNVSVEIDIADGEIDMTTNFTLPPGSDEVDLTKDAISLNLAGGRCRYAVTLPAGTFKADKEGGFVFRGSISKVNIDASLRRHTSGAYVFALETEGADLRGAANPVSVSITVGRYSGSKSVRAHFE